MASETLHGGNVGTCIEQIADEAPAQIMGRKPWKKPRTAPWTRSSARVERGVALLSAWEDPTSSAPRTPSLFHMPFQQRLERHAFFGGISDIIEEAGSRGCLRWIGRGLGSTFVAETTPIAITNYFDADAKRDTTAVVALFSDDAEVIDEGQTWRGVDRIRAWREGLASKYAYTTRVFRTKHVTADEYLVIGRLDGNFPGGTANLRWRFTLVGDRIKTLHIGWRGCAPTVEKSCATRGNDESSPSSVRAGRPWRGRTRG